MTYEIIDTRDGTKTKSNNERISRKNNT